MSAATSIEWTDTSWNPVRGCSRVSSGCDHCYAMGQAHRFSGTGKPFEGLTTIRRGKVDWTGVARLVSEMLDAPLRWRKPQRIFVNSMSDLFHESLTDAEIMRVWLVMARAQHHTFQVLTKRPKRAAAWLKRWCSVEGHEDEVQLARGPSAVRAAHTSGRALMFADVLDGMGAPPPGAAFPTYDWAEGPRWLPSVLPNVWLGVSVEDQKTADDRLSELLDIPAAVRFASYEPALGPVDFWAFLKSEIRDKALAALKSSHTPGIDWVIVGGESGPGARPFNLDWASSVVDRCEAAKVACFVKQLGARPCITEEAWRKLLHGVVPLLSPQSEHPSVREAGLVQLALRDKKGGDMAEWPEPLRVRQFPEVRT